MNHKDYMLKNDLFYVGYRELFEKPDRKGYTTEIKDAGKWSLEDARSMTEFPCANGRGRWYISCEALDTFNGERLIPMEVY